LLTQAGVGLSAAGTLGVELRWWSIATKPLPDLQCERYRDWNRSDRAAAHGRRRWGRTLPSRSAIGHPE